MSNKLKNFFGYFNFSIFFLILLTYLICIGILVKEIFFSSYVCRFNSGNIIFSNYNSLLIPYIVASILFFLIFFIFYKNKSQIFITYFIKDDDIYNNTIISFILILILYLLLSLLFYDLVNIKLFVIKTIIYGFFIIAFSIAFFIKFNMKYWFNIGLTFIFLLMIYEVLNISFRRPYVMNEYQQLNEFTYINNNLFSDEEFLHTFDIENTKQLYKKYYESNIKIFETYKIQNLLVENILNEFLINNNFTRYLPNEPNEKINKFSDSIQFFKKNKFEYLHRNMNRGQIDHISYVLCPINEYINGKPLKYIYFQ